MSLSFIWHENAILSLQEENTFILKKWNEQEVEKFNNLVNENLERLLINPKIGLYNKQLNTYCLVISKQTTLYYDFNLDLGNIELLIFWNNLKNPDDLIKLL